MTTHRSAEEYSLDSFSDRGIVYNIDLWRYLSRFLKPTNTQEVDPARYRIFLTRGRRYWQHRDLMAKYRHLRRDTIYRDAKYSFILVKVRTKRTGEIFWLGPLACMAFDLEDDSVIVEQIQGAPGAKEHLKPFRWEKMLLQMIIDWARDNKFRTVEVMNSKDSRWWSEGDKKRERILHMKYDVTPKRCGFKFDKNKNRSIFILTKEVDSKEGVCAVA